MLSTLALHCVPAGKAGPTGRRDHAIGQRPPSPAVTPHPPRSRLPADGRGHGLGRALLGGAPCGGFPREREGPQAAGGEQDRSAAGGARRAAQGRERLGWQPASSPTVRRCASALPGASPPCGLRGPRGPRRLGWGGSMEAGGGGPVVREHRGRAGEAVGGASVGAEAVDVQRPREPRTQGAPPGGHHHLVLWGHSWRQSSGHPRRRKGHEEGAGLSQLGPHCPAPPQVCEALRQPAGPGPAPPPPPPFRPDRPREEAGLSHPWRGALSAPCPPSAGGSRRGRVGNVHRATRSWYCLTSAE